MKFEEFYGDAYISMKTAERVLCDLMEHYSEIKREKDGMMPIVYYCSRIKSPHSMLKKLQKRGLPETSEAALTCVYDAIGIRAVCAFAEDVYRLVRWLREQTVFSIIEEKDYFAYPKPNGYRSYHVIVKMNGMNENELYAEIQVRTIANDFWAALEHQLKYKSDLKKSGDS